MRTVGARARSAFRSAGKENFKRGKGCFAPLSPFSIYSPPPSYPLYLAANLHCRGRGKGVGVETPSPARGNLPFPRVGDFLFRNPHYYFPQMPVHNFFFICLSILDL